MCRRAFVGLRRLSVPADYRKQRRKRQDDYDFAANAVDLLPMHRITYFPEPTTKNFILAGLRE
jgi:hypothetical protein